MLDVCMEGIVLRIRTVKPEFFKHSGLFDAEIESKLPLRLGYIGLFGFCDREGRFKWKSREMKLDILPYDDLDFEHVLIALEKHKFICKYTLDGVDYGYIPSWHKHQIINNRERDSILPSPPIFLNHEYEHNGSICNTRVDDVSATRDTHDGNVSYSPLCLAQEEGKGMERKKIDNNISMLKLSGRDDDVLEIFRYWQMNLSHPNAKFDKKRQRIIECAFALDYSIEDLKLAIDGCAKSPWHMGDNPYKKKYDSIGLIFRDADKIEEFIAMTRKNSPGAIVSNEIYELTKGAL